MLLLCYILWDSGHYITIAIFSMLSLSHSLLAFTDIMSENLQWPDCTLSQLRLIINKFFIWRNVVHWLANVIGYSTIASFHSSISLVFLTDIPHFKAFSLHSKLKSCPWFIFYYKFSELLVTSTTSTLLLVYLNKTSKL